MLARAKEEIGDVVERRELLVGDVAQEVDVGSAQVRDERRQQREVGLEAAVRADEEQPRPRIVPRAIDVKGADHVLELLVRDHAADEHHVGPLVVESRRERAIRCQVEVAEVGNDRQHAGGGEAERLEFLAVVFGVAEREVAAVDVGGQFAPAPETELDEIVVDAEEVLGRRDVVVDERHPAGQRIRDARGAGSDREVMDQDVFGGDRRRSSRDSPA